VEGTVPAGFEAPVQPMQMVREPGAAARPRPAEQDVMKFLDGRRSAFGLAAPCPCGGPPTLQSRVKELSKNCTRINLPIGDGASGSVVFGNPLQDTDLFALAELLSMGAFVSVRTLNLQNQPGFGMEAHLVSQVERPPNGLFHGRHFGSTGFAALMEAARIGGGLPLLTRMNLAMNYIDDGCMEALAAALAVGAFPSLILVKLYRNPFGDRGIQALARALGTPGARPALVDVYLGMTPNQIASLSPDSKAALEAAGCAVTTDDQGKAGSDVLRAQTSQGRPCSVHFAATGAAVGHSGMNTHTLERGSGVPTH